MRRLLACLAASAFVLGHVPDTSAAPGASAYGRGGLSSGPAFRQPVRFGSARGALGFNRLGNGSRFGHRSRLGDGWRFGYGSRFGYGGYGYGGYSRGDVQQNVFVGGGDDGDAPWLDRFPITATTGIAPSPTPEPVIYVISARGSDRSATRPGAKALQVGGRGTAEPTGTRVVAVTVPRGR